MKKVYYEIAILDSCGDWYDTINRKHAPQTLRECALEIFNQKKHDKELGKDYGVWDYRIIEYEETDDEILYTIYKVYKYRGRLKVKEDTELFL